MKISYQTLGLSVPAVAVIFGLTLANRSIAQSEDTVPTIVPAYVGSQTCSGCHADQFALWEDSHHSWAWREPVSDNVLGNFTGDEFVHGDETTRFLEHDGRYVIEVEDESGATASYELRAAVGVAPLQQYLVETEEGRLQAHDVAWGTEFREWYHLYPDQTLDSGDGLHWTGSYKTWNARCAECHATGYDKAYDPRARSYASTQAEIGVGCEACHGPGEAHLAWARSPDDYTVVWPGLSASGFTIEFTAGNPDVELDQCAGCHSRREPLGSSSPVPGTPFGDSYRLALLRDGLYHADGQILDEVYVYGSFLQSRMYEEGVRCSNCHEVHGAELVAEGNAVCTQCHNPQGRPDFPSLPVAEYDSPLHHFHDPDIAAAQCVSCHMPERTYMITDGRRDHSFRVPRPDHSESLGVPNACTNCHEDETASWALEQVETWYPEGRTGTPHYGEVFAAARRDLSVDVQNDLLELVEDVNSADIVRATALDHLKFVSTPELAESLVIWLEDRSALVRAAAAAAQRGALGPVRVQALSPLLVDPVRSVRISAAQGLIDLLPVLASGTSSALDNAVREYQSALIAKADFPEAQMVIAGTAMILGSVRGAQAALSEAVRMDPQLIEAWSSLARLELRGGDADAARQSIVAAIAANPDSVDLHHSLAQVSAMQGDTAAALDALRRATALAPDDGLIAADLGQLLVHVGDHAAALPVLERALELGAVNAETLFALASAQLAERRIDDLRETADRMEALFPETELTQSVRNLIP